MHKITTSYVGWAYAEMLVGDLKFSPRNDGYTLYYSLSIVSFSVGVEDDRTQIVLAPWPYAVKLHDALVTEKRK